MSHMTAESLEIPLGFLRCPVTHSQLHLEEGDLLSPGGLTYRQHPRHGFYSFIPEGLPELKSPRWRTWEHLQANAVVPYTVDPIHNLGVGKRQDFLDFADFCGFHGFVLDIGAGPQACPTHIEYTPCDDVTFYGIDPLIGDQPKGYRFAQALGEYLPFADDIFDQALFVTTIDHFTDPWKALREATRIVKPGGDICVWFGEKDDDAPVNLYSPSWYTRLKVPDLASDVFHFERFTEAHVRTLVRDSGLEVVQAEITPVDEWRRNHFYRIRS